MCGAAFIKNFDPSPTPLSHLFPLSHFHYISFTMAESEVYDGAIGIDLGMNCCSFA